MNIIINNAEDAYEYIKKIKGSVIAELLFCELMKQPEPVRIRLYEMLIGSEQKESGELR